MRNERIFENRPRWFGRVMRKEETEAVRAVMIMNDEGKRGRGKPRITNRFGDQKMHHSILNISDK